MDVFMSTMGQSFTGSGAIFMWAIFIPMFVAVGLVVERVFFLYIKSGMNGRKVINTVTSYLKKDDVEGALNFVASVKSPLGRVINSVLENRNSGEERINKAVEEVFLEETPVIQRFLPLLSAMANVATLLGLLGTIIGLILAFDAVANVPAAQRAQALATGISVAMATTAFGLVVAIPALFAHGLFTSQADKVLEQMDEVAAKLTNVVLLKPDRK